MQYSSDLTLMIDEHGVIQYASPALESVTGIAPEDALGVELCSLIPEDEAGRLTRQLEPLAGTREQLPVEFSMLHQDGSKLYLDGTVVNLLEEAAVGAVVFNVRDITQRRELEAELAAARVPRSAHRARRTARCCASGSAARRRGPCAARSATRP